MKAPWLGLVTAAAMGLTFLLAVPAAAVPPAPAEIVYSISPDDGNLRTISPTTGMTLSSVPILVGAAPVLGGNGLALNLTTGLLWALVRISTTPANTRELVTINPAPPNCVATCVATSIGNTGGAFAGLAFSGATLFAVTGEQATSAVKSESLFTLNTTTAAPTLACELGRGSQGEALGFNTDDAVLYHASGVLDTIFETVEEPSVGPLCLITDISIGPALKAREVEALGFRPLVGTFFWSQGSTIPTAALYDVTADGVETLIGALDHVSKGIAVGPGIPPLDHFTCYTVLATATLTPEVVVLEDQFREATLTAGRALRLCNPTNKNGETPGAEAHPDHLGLYALSQSSPPTFPGVNGLVINDQFGTLFLDALTPSGLLVPSAKSLMSSPPPLGAPLVDHFVCYTVRTTPSKPPFVRVNGVSILDQFGARTVDLSKPSRLCNPANKNGEDPGAETHTEHLMCYETQGVTPAFATVNPVFVNNQFGAQQLRATTLSEFCVPALKTLPTPP
jgi:hypothetical protein